MPRVLVTALLKRYCYWYQDISDTFLKIKILGKILVSKSTLEHVFFEALVLQCATLQL